jgi:O-glycosyl hydrolase
LVVAIGAIGCAAAQDTVLLREWSPPSAAISAEYFRFDASPDKVQSGNWRVAGLPRTYFRETLPALFERTLVIDQLRTRAGALNWLFTGELGGFTVRAEQSQVRVFQRYYDSFALGDPAAPTRHPERITIESAVAYQGNLRAITVRLDAKLGLSVLLNGEAVVRQHCLLDVSRHQLAWVGNEGTASGYLLPVQTADATIEVNASQSRQTMLGFGGITSPAAYAQLSPEGKRRWWSLVAEYNLLLHREYPMGARLNPEMNNWDRLEEATPHYYGDNFPNGEISDFTYIRNIRRLGGKVLFEFWALPAWARRDRTDAQGQFHSGVADPEPYARAMVRYCQVARERAGSAPDVVGIQNEVPQPPEIWRQMTLSLRDALDRAGFKTVKIHMRDDGRLASGIECARAFRESETVWKAIDYAAVHLYDYQKFFYDPDAFDALLGQWREVTGDKPFLSTELSVNSNEFQIRSYRLALSMGQLYHKNLTLANASAILYCWLLLNVEQPSYGWTRSLFVPEQTDGSIPRQSSYQARVFGAYSRRVRAGMVRVDARPSNPDLLVTAFAGAGGARTLVLLNRSLQPQIVRVQWQGKPFRFLEEASPYAQNSVTSPASSTEVTVKPGAIATLSTEELGHIDFTPEGLHGKP